MDNAALPNDADQALVPAVRGDAVEPTFPADVEPSLTQDTAAAEQLTEVTPAPDSHDLVLAAELAGLGAGTIAVPSTPLADDEPRVHAWKRVVRELAGGVQTLFSAAVYATLIVTFGFQVARVDGLSMAPTLEDHDRLIVNKLVYELGDPQARRHRHALLPARIPTRCSSSGSSRSEGDIVRIVDGHVYVNDIPLHDDYVPDEFRSHDDWGPTVIQQGYYFVMGDHRNNSSDSRHWGQVPKKYIVGKVKVRWWPLQQARLF